jgi:hypothetical protein
MPRLDNIAVRPYNMSKTVHMQMRLEKERGEGGEAGGSDLYQFRNSSIMKRLQKIGSLLCAQLIHAQL